MNGIFLLYDNQSSAGHFIVILASQLHENSHLIQKKNKNKKTKYDVYLSYPIFLHHTN